MLQCSPFKCAHSASLLQDDRTAFYSRPTGSFPAGPNDITAEAERQKDKKCVYPKCVTESTMLTQNTTVAPDRHKRAHLLVTGKYGSIS